MAKQKEKKEYLSYYEAMTKGGTRRAPRSTWTQAQYISASPQQRQLAKAGIEHKKVKRMK